jgi:short-subunit dehydrogenase
MADTERGTALVTGASSGIGRELARELAANGHSLILVARDPIKMTAAADELRTKHGVSAQVHAKDLSEPGAAEDLWSELTEDGATVDILVNNAGIGAYGQFADQPIEVVARMQMTNVLALTALTRLALPDMLARKRGRILNVASVVGYQPAGPRMAVYYATKAYVLSFSKGLARELDGSGVSVTTLSPGVTRSSFEDRSDARETRLYALFPQASARTVARVGYRAMMRGRRVAIPGVMTKLLAIAGELPPRSIALAVNGWLLRKP